MSALNQKKRFIAVLLSGIISLCLMGIIHFVVPQTADAHSFRQTEPPQLLDFEVSHDGKWVAELTDRGTRGTWAIYTYPTDQREIFTLIGSGVISSQKTAPNFFSISISPDDAYILLNSADEVRVISSNGLVSTRIYTKTNLSGSSINPVFSPDSRQIIYKTANRLESIPSPEVYQRFYMMGNTSISTIRFLLTAVT